MSSQVTASPGTTTDLPTLVSKGECTYPLKPRTPSGVVGTVHLSVGSPAHPRALRSNATSRRCSRTTPAPLGTVARPGPGSVRIDDADTNMIDEDRVPASTPTRPPADHGRTDERGVLCAGMG